MGETQIVPVKFALQYARGRLPSPGGEDVEILIDCFDQAPHYHYGPKE